MIEFEHEGTKLSFPEHKVPEWAEEYVRQMYLRRDEKGVPCETLREGLERVIHFVGGEGRLASEDQEALLKLTEAGTFYPNVVFLMNAGTEVKNLAACYALVIEDSMESIRDSLALATDILTAGGGIGLEFSKLRPKGVLVKSNGGGVCGPVSVMRQFDSLISMVKSSGRRRGAAIGTLSWDHPDIEEFITCKSVLGEFENFNLSVRVTNVFMEKVEEGDADCLRLFRLMAEQAHKTGDPGLLFEEALNRDNPRPDLGRILVSNPCGEVVLPAPFACNLAAIDVSKFVSVKGVFLNESFRAAARLVCRFLNAGLDCGGYVGELARERMAEIRPVGVGIMGFADYLLKLKIKYGSIESARHAEMVAQLLQVTATETLLDSGTRIAHAPAGSMSALAGCSTGIEPVFAWRFTRRIQTTGKEVELVHPMLPDEYSSLPSYFVTAHDVAPRDHIRIAAAFQKYTDGGVSKTVNLSETATVEDVENSFTSAWLAGCKGVTVFRDKCKRQILSTGESKLIGRRRLADTRPSTTHHFTIGGTDGYITAGMFPNGDLGELFITVAKGGSTVRGLLDCFGIASSLCLQYGVPRKDLIQKFVGEKWEPNGMTNNKDIPFAKSIVDYVLQWVDREFGEDEPDTPVLQYRSGDVCPLCGAEMIHEARCARCTCGYSRCS